MKSHFVAALGMSLLLVGCARIEPRESFDGVRDSIAQRSDLRVEWRGVTAEDEAVDDAIDQILQSELNVDQAVQIALLNNRNLQATYEELGIAQADLVQVGLLSNPVFDLAVRFPTRSGEGTNIEMSLVQNFLDVLFIPARKKIAASQFESAKLRVAGEVIDLASEVSQAFYELQGSQQTLEMRQTVQTSIDAAAELARRLREAGNITALELAEHEALAAQTRVELVAAEAQVQTDREKLARLMGIAGRGSDWKVATRLPDLPPDSMDTDELQSLALAQRLDVQSAREQTSALQRAAKLVDSTRYLSEADIGASAEREPEGFWVVGPAVTVPIPLFDQGQASVAAARARFRQGQQIYLAKLNEARADVRTASAQLDAARAQVEHLRNTVLPLRARVLEQAQLEYNGMLIGAFQLLEAKRAQIEAGADYIEALRDYWIARSELRRAVGGKLPVGAVSATSPAKPQATTAPATSNHQLHQHHGEQQ